MARREHETRRTYIIKSTSNVLAQSEGITCLTFSADNGRYPKCHLCIRSCCYKKSKFLHEDMPESLMYCLCHFYCSTYPFFLNHGLRLVKQLSSVSVYDFNGFSRTRCNGFSRFRSSPCCSCCARSSAAKDLAVVTVVVQLAMSHSHHGTSFACMTVCQGASLQKGHAPWLTRLVARRQMSTTGCLVARLRRFQNSGSLLSLLR